MFAPQLEASSSICQACSSLMPLLTQIYCPLDSSALERILYVFGCPKSTCRGQSGSVRCWRASVPWVEEDAETEEGDKKEEIVIKKEEGNRLGNLIFGETGGLFGSTTPTPNTINAVNFNPFAPATPINLSSNPFAPATFTPSLESLSIESKPKPLTKTPRIKAPVPPTPTSWISPPSFPAQYLTTAYEPPSTISSIAIPASAVILPAINEDAKHRDGKGAGGRVKKGGNVGGTGTGAGDEWGREGYEVQKVKGVDEVFLGFQERVGREGKQCIR